MNPPTIRRLEELRGAQVRVLGPDTPATLVTRGNLVGCLREAGRIEETVRRLEELVADQAGPWARSPRHAWLPATSLRTGWGN